MITRSSSTRRRVVIRRTFSCFSPRSSLSSPRTPSPPAPPAPRHASPRGLIRDGLGSAGHASSTVVSPVKFGYIDLDNYPKFDPNKCQALLDEAGFPNGKGLPPLEYITSVGFYPKTKEYG